jgi:hypothetical protein
LLFIRILIYKQLNVLEWTILRADDHVFPTAHASIRILITAVLLVRALLFTPTCWKLRVALGKKLGVISMLICATGVGTLVLTGIELKHYLDHKEEGLSPNILWYRILEAHLNVVFICFPQARQFLTRGKNDGRGASSFILAPDSHSYF